MTTVLIIDDDASARAYVRAAAPGNWTILEAGDGLGDLPLLSLLPTQGTVVPDVMGAQFAATPLSAREREVLWLDHHGQTLVQIAQTLGVTRATVTSHWKHAQRKLGLERSALQAWFRERVRSRSSDV